MKKLLAIVALAGTLALPVSAYADSEVVDKIAPNQVSSILNEMGFTDTEFDSDRDIIFRMQGMKVMMITGSSKGKYLQLRFSIRGSSANVQLMNKWNKGHKYSRAFIDADGDPNLVSDLDLAGGVTPERIRDFIRTFGFSLSAFLKEIS